MATFEKTIIRCAIDVTSKTPFKDVYTGKAPAFWNSTDIQFQLGFFKGSGDDAELLDITNFDSVTIEVKAMTDKTGAAYMSKTVNSGELNTSLVVADWNDGSNQHATVDFPYTEADLPMGSEDTVVFWLVVHGVTTDLPVGKDTFGCSTLTAYEDGISGTGQPVQAGNIIPGGAEYDGSGEYTLATTTGRTYKWTKGANDTNVVNGTETITTTDTIFIAQGTSITLNGTPSEDVTAVIRLAPYLNADETDARYMQLAGAIRISNNRLQVKCTDDNKWYDLVIRMNNGVPVAAVEGAGEST